MIRLARILVSPRDVFNKIRDTTPFALPFFSILIVAFLCLVVQSINYDNVTVGVLQDDGSVVSKVSNDLVLYFGFGAVVVWVWSAIWISCICLGWSVYYWAAGKLLSVDKGWRHWFGFACWTAVPAILGLVADTLYLSFASSGPFLLFSSFPFELLAVNHVRVYWIPVFLIWTAYIAVHGFMSWTERNLSTSLMVVLPSVVAVGLLQYAPMALFMG